MIDGFAHSGADLHPAGADVEAAVIGHDLGAVQLHIGITVGVPGRPVAVTVDIQGHGDGALVLAHVLGIGIYNFDCRAVAIIFDKFGHYPALHFMPRLPFARGIQSKYPLDGLPTVKRSNTSALVIYSLLLLI